MIFDIDIISNYKHWSIFFSGSCTEYRHLDFKVECTVNSRGNMLEKVASYMLLQVINDKLQF